MRRVMFVLFWLASFALQAEEIVFPMADISIGGKPLKVEYADTFELRAQGLMHRTSLCADCGMLFNYKKPRRGSMWMKNTLIPLDVAFIDKKGAIVDIKAMFPHDLTSVQSSKPVKYALEMNQGWFKKQDIKVGDRLTIDSP